MPASFQDVLNSRIFKFTVGKEIDSIATEFSVYEEAIAQLSDPLEKMMKGGMGGKFSESQAGATVWPDVRKATFERFVQYAYTGDYSIPDPDPVALGKDGVNSILRSRSLSIRSDGWDAAINPTEEIVPDPVVDTIPEPPPATEPEPPQDLGWDEWGSFSKPSKKKKMRTMQEKSPIWRGPTLGENFHMLQYPILAPRNNYADHCEPASDFKKGHTYSNIFLSHAALFVLGDFWLIDSLKALALYKLHKTLCVFKLDDTNVSDVLDLARYAYQEEAKGSEEGIGDLRNLVCQYMASKAIELTLNEGFKELLVEDGQFVMDLWMFTVQR